MSAFQDILVANQFVAAAVLQGVHSTSVIQLVRTRVCQCLSLSLSTISFLYPVAFQLCALCIIINLLGSHMNIQAWSLVLEQNRITPIEQARLVF